MGKPRGRPKKIPVPVAEGEQKPLKPPSKWIHQPTDDLRQQVLKCCGMGLTQNQIARIIGITKPTLHKYYRPELDLGEAQKTHEVSKNLFYMATNPDHKDSAKAAIYWLQQRSPEEWQKVKRVEHTGKDGGAIQTEIKVKQVVDSRMLTPDQRQALREILIAAAAQNDTRPVIEHQDDGDYGDDGDDGDDESRHDAEGTEDAA
jgi:hypothetical protein